MTTKKIYFKVGLRVVSKVQVFGDHYINPSWGSFTKTNTKIYILDNLDGLIDHVYGNYLCTQSHQWFLLIFDSGPPPAFPLYLNYFCYFVNGRTLYSLNSLKSVKFSRIVLLKND